MREERNYQAMSDMDRMHELARDLGLKQGFLWPDAWMEFLKFTLADKFGVEWTVTCGNKFNIKRDDYVRHYIMFDEEEEAQAARERRRLKGGEPSQMSDWKFANNFCWQGGKIILWHNGRVMPQRKVEEMLRESKPVPCSQSCPVWQQELANGSPASLEVDISEEEGEIELGPTIEDM